MELNTQYLTKVGQFLDANKISVRCRALHYVVDDIYYCVNGDGWWYFEDEPKSLGWTKCDPPIGIEAKGDRGI